MIRPPTTGVTWESMHGLGGSGSFSIHGALDPTSCEATCSCGTWAWRKSMLLHAGPRAVSCIRALCTLGSVRTGRRPARLAGCVAGHCGLCAVAVPCAENALCYRTATGKNRLVCWGPVSSLSSVTCVVSGAVCAIYSTEFGFLLRKADGLYGFTHSNTVDNPRIIRTPK